MMNFVGLGNFQVREGDFDTCSRSHVGPVKRVLGKTCREVVPRIANERAAEQSCQISAGRNFAAGLCNVSLTFLQVGLSVHPLSNFENGRSRSLASLVDD